MHESKETNLFKDFHELELFFSSDHIRLHSTQEYFKEKGIFAFSNEKDAMAGFASKFYVGADSLRNLIRFTGVKAFPKMSGFILDVIDNDTSLEDLYDYFNSHKEEEFPKVKEGKITNVIIDQNIISLYVEYNINEIMSYNIFDTVKKEANFEISKNGNIFTVTLILNRNTDYSVIYGILNIITTNDPNIKLKLIESDLCLFPTTEKRHLFFEDLMEALNKKYEVIGIIKYNRNKAEDLNTDDSFEDNHLKGSQEVNRMSITEILENLRKRSAFLEGANVVLYNRKLKQLFVVQLLSKANKKRFEIGLASDVKKVEQHDTVEKIRTKTDINDLESAYLNEYEKQDILKTIWDIITEKFYEYRVEMLEESKRLLENTIVY
jgi:hypothetical protein